MAEPVSALTVVVDQWGQDPRRQWFDFGLCLVFVRGEEDPLRRAVVAFRFCCGCGLLSRRGSGQFLYDEDCPLHGTRAQHFGHWGESRGPVVFDPVDWSVPPCSST